MKLSDIKDLVRAGKFDDALSACEQLLKLSGDERKEGLRARAYVYLRRGDIELAFQDHESLVDADGAVESDIYMAAHDALEFSRYREALLWMERLLSVASGKGNHAFDAVVHFQTAYASMQLGDFDGALRSLNEAVKINPNISLPIPGEEGMASAQDLKEEIERRVRGARPR